MSRILHFRLAALFLLALAALGAQDCQPGHTLVPRAEFTDDLNQRHIRLQHYYRGLRVWGSEAAPGPALSDGN
jgi:hypothetical protein